MKRTFNQDKVPGHNQWTSAELKLISKLRTPAAVQSFLDTLRYSVDSFYRSPRRVLKERVAHCADGAVFAAAVLRHLGYRPLLVDLLADDDDDHILAVFKGPCGWGAVSKSNTVGLRYREPVHRTIRDLVISYFEWYFNLKRKKTLRSFSRPFSLARYDRLDWISRDSTLDLIMEKLDAVPHTSLLTPSTIRNLRPVDERSFRGGLYGTRWEGLYGFKKKA